ncbi:MAG TPA: serpin family protein [Gemmatimonadaceae bacterium]|nr:serpin family protein [Gemmatimonadaceae bacterium]
MSFPRRRSQLALVCALVLAACADPTGSSGAEGRLPRPLTDAEKAVVGASNQFAFALLGRVNAEHPGDNLFISPLSVSMALGMTMNGTAGATMSEMRGMLGFGSLPLEDVNASYRSLIELLRGLDGRVDFRIANAIWYDDAFPVEEPFVNITRTFFDARVDARPFTDPATVQTINDWVRTATAGKIEEILDAIPPDAVMYLLNAIYFKGDWTTQFDPELTAPQPFAGHNGPTTVPLMHVTDSVRYAEIDGTQLIELPYGGGAFAMSVVLPPSGEDIEAFLAEFTTARWNALHGAAARTPVMIWLPKFTLEQDYTLNDALQALGMRLAFDGGDFTPMSGAHGRELAVSKVKHKTFVDVHEEGTEAAAVTSVEIIRVCACGPLYPAFRADRPFLFAIRERASGTILFVGKVGAL